MLCYDIMYLVTLFKQDAKIILLYLPHVTFNNHIFHCMPMESEWRKLSDKIMFL